MSTIFVKVTTAWQLGAESIARALFYRLGLRLGINSVKSLSEATPQGPFFYPPTVDHVPRSTSPAPMYIANAFGLDLDMPQTAEPPRWHHSVLTGQALGKQPWWEIPDFEDSVGDIKGIWEMSRFDWALSFAQQAVAGSPEALERLNIWLSNWCEQNPPYIGANWKCGQEASIRVMHLAMCARLLRQIDFSTKGLMALIRVHLRRIAPTIQYAIAQDNNHGTSEAAALFIGGSWLAEESDDRRLQREARRWMKQGRNWLENRARKLVEADGSFSQGSINYHRVMLDTYSIAEIWRRSLRLPAFSVELEERLQAATSWLGNMVSPDGSDTPNLGANDGARLLPLSDSDYRDVRPSVQLASVLFSGLRVFKEGGGWDDSLKWLEIDIPEQAISYQCTRQYDDGGYYVLRYNQVMALLCYPRFRFRPSQSDLLHLDFWVGELNIFRDAGSYSYNCSEPWQSYFPSSVAHNTVQFDGRNSMPRLSRFLFGAWPKAIDVSGIDVIGSSQRASAGYRDWKGASHKRAVELFDSGLLVTDEMQGFQESAVLRWRLAPGDWRWQDGVLLGHGMQIRIEASQPLRRCELIEGWESRYYSKKTPLPVLEVEIERPGTLKTVLTY